MKVIAINVDKIDNSTLCRTDVEVNVEDGVERISRDMFDNGTVNSSLAISTSGMETSKINSYKFDVIVEIENTLTTLTGSIDTEFEISTGGLVDEDTIFRVSSTNTISLKSSLYNKKEILNVQTGETTVRSVDIASTSLGASLFNAQTSNVNNVRARNVNGVISTDDTIISASNKAITLTTSQQVAGKGHQEALIETATNLSAGTTETSIFFQFINMNRGLESPIGIGDTAFTYGELSKIVGGQLPPVTSAEYDLVDGSNITKELALVSSRIIKILQWFSQITMVVDTHSGKSLINGKVIYAPGLKQGVHNLAMLNPTVLLEDTIKELAILTYGANSGGGYMLVSITKMLGEPKIEISITSEFASAEYTLRDDSSFYSTLISNDVTTLEDISSLTLRVMDNMSMGNASMDNSIVA